MANIFQDVGRSNLFQVGQGVFKDVMAVGEQERQGYLGALSAQEAQRRTSILQAEEARRIQEDARKQEAYDKEKAWNASPYNVKFSPLLTVHQDAEDYPQKFETFRQLAGADEMGNTTNEGMMRAANLIKSNPELAKQWFKPRLDSLETEIIANDKKLYQANLVGDEESVKKLSGIQKTLRTQYMMKSGEFGKMVLQEEKPPKPVDHWVDENRVVDGKKVEGQRNPATNEWRQRAQGQNISINVPTPDETSSIVQMIHDNGLDPTQIPKRGGVWNKAMAEWKKQYPQENINDYAAFARWKRDISVNKSMTLLDSIEPMLVNMKQLHDKLGLSQFTDVNKMKVWLKQHTGDPDVVKYETYMRNVVQELPPAMTGYFPTDTRIMMELKNLETAKAPAQIGAAIDAVRDLVRVRRQQFNSPSWSPLMKNQAKPESKRLTYNPTTGELE